METVFASIDVSSRVSQIWCYLEQKYSEMLHGYAILDSLFYEPFRSRVESRPSFMAAAVASSYIKRPICRTLSQGDIKSTNLPRPILLGKCVLVGTSHICSLNAFISFRICLSLCCCNSHFLYMSWHKSSAAEYLS